MQPSSNFSPPGESSADLWGERSNLNGVSLMSVAYGTRSQMIHCNDSYLCLTGSLLFRLSVCAVPPMLQAIATIKQQPSEPTGTIGIYLHRLYPCHDLCGLSTEVRTDDIHRLPKYTWRSKRVQYRILLLLGANGCQLLFCCFKLVC